MITQIKAIKSNSQPMEPIPTETAPHLPVFEGIKAIVFDVYGTLFISSSGDISIAQKQDREDALRAALTASHIELVDPPEDLRITDLFYDEVKSAQDVRRKEGVKYPEVEIREVWASVIGTLHDRELIESSPDLERVTRFAVEYECRVNQVWPMPNIVETLTAIEERNMHLGIVSNAQFYTPLLFEALLKKPYRHFGFDDDICVWSFIEREGKPSTRLYEILAEKLDELEVAPDDTLYIGNDIRNDIWPARVTGFKTVLFAGDKRSLRLREDDPECSNIKPDAIITDLSQLLNLLGD